MLKKLMVGWVFRDSLGHMQTCSEITLQLQKLTDHILGLWAT